MTPGATAATPPVRLADWLAYCERLHPKTIAMGLERVRAVAARLDGGRGLRIGCPLVVVAGTNGKGSTCAMLESVYRAAGYRTGLYTSPHLVDFEERCRIDGQVAQATALLPAFAEIEAARRGDGSTAWPEIALTYFEFTTLAIVLTLARAGLDVMILEVGLGGRLDAVNAFDTDCAIVTSIDLDHVEYLGPDREAIGFEKAGILRVARPAIVSDPAPPRSLLAHAHAIGAELRCLGRDFRVVADGGLWHWTGRRSRLQGLAPPALRGANQLGNAAGVLAALEALQARLPVAADAVRHGLANVELAGRFQVLSGRPAIVLDVAHNAHSVAALATNLEAMGATGATHAVFGAMADKDLRPMFEHIGPLVDHWYFTDLPLPRAATARELAARWREANRHADRAASEHSSPTAALQAALGRAGDADRIVVFGSFHTVGGVLREGVPVRKAGMLAPGAAGAGASTAVQQSPVRAVPVRQGARIGGRRREGARNCG